MSLLHVESAGEGPTLVLVHGWGMNLRIFDGLCAELQRTHHVLSIDLPGHGRSSWQPHYTMATLLDELLVLVPTGASIVGWSLGSQLALRAAQRLGSAVHALILLGPTPRFCNGADWPHGVAPAVLDEFALSLREDPARLMRNFFELQLRGSRIDAGVVRQLQLAVGAHGVAAPAALEAGLQWLAAKDLRADAASILHPTLIISGQRDRVTPPGAAKALAALMPRATLAELPRAAHLPFVSHLEQTTRLMQDFLSATRAAAA